MSKLIENSLTWGLNKSPDDIINISGPVIISSGKEMAPIDETELAIRWLDNSTRPTLHSFIVDQNTLPLPDNIARLLFDGIGDVIEINTVMGLHHIDMLFPNDPQRWAARILIGPPYLDGIVEVICLLCTCHSAVTSHIVPKEYYDELSDPHESFTATNVKLN